MLGAGYETWRQSKFTSRDSITWPQGRSTGCTGPADVDGWYGPTENIRVAFNPSRNCFRCRFFSRRQPSILFYKHVTHLHHKHSGSPWHHVTQACQHPQHTPVLGFPWIYDVISSSYLGDLEYFFLLLPNYKSSVGLREFCSKESIYRTSFTYRTGFTYRTSLIYRTSCRWECLGYIRQMYCVADLLDFLLLNCLLLYPLFFRSLFGICRVYFVIWKNSLLKDVKTMVN